MFAAVRAIVGGAFLCWLGTEHEATVASQCSLSRAAELPLVCRVPAFMTTAGFALAGLGVVAIALRVARSYSKSRAAADYENSRSM